MTILTQKFLRSDAVTSAWEGGYVNHAKDPGGPTDRGVTQATYDGWRKKKGLAPRPVRGITAIEAQQLFYEDFWLASGSERLAAGVDLATYDASVNSGVKRGRAWLMASIGGPDHETVKRICVRRLGFMQMLKIWKTFGKGWSRRVADIQAKGVAWALAAANDNSVVSQQLEDEAAAKKTVAARQNTAAGGTGASGTGAIVADQTTNIADWLLLGLGVGLVALAAWLVLRAMQNRQQAEAFANEAEAIA